MKQLAFVGAFLLLQCPQMSAQILRYLGFRAEVSTLQLTLSEDAAVKASTPYGVGLAFHYPFTQTWEMTMSGMASFYNVTGNTRNYNAATQKWIAGSSKTINITAFEADYTILHGFGDAQHIKVGAGVWYSALTSSRPTLTTDTESWGSNAALAKNYQLNSLFGLSNYGVLFEGLYNVNDALQFSVRYKLGFGNLYKTETAVSGSAASWQQNSLNLGVVYYFGAEKRGTKQPTKDKKKNIDFN